MYTHDYASKGYYYCNRCHTWHSHDDMEPSEVVTEHGVETWCSACAARDSTECECCGATIGASIATDTQDGEVCPKCLEDHYMLCDCCGDWAYADYMHVVRDEYENVAICGNCYETEATTCAHCCCDVLRDTTDYVTVGYDYRYGNLHELWCCDCSDEHVSTCDHCGEETAAEQLEDVGDESWCPACVENNTMTCEGCGCMVDETRAVHIDYEWYCPECADRGALHDYSYKPEPEFHGEMTGVASGLYLGIELETEEDDAQNMAESIVGGRDEFYCKKDGSIDGAEIVSHPCTPAHHLGSGMWEEAVGVCKRYHATSHDNGNCGMHVHISRRYFGGYGDSVTGAYKLYRLISTFSDEWVKFSRRTSGEIRSWCRIAQPDEYCIDLSDSLVSKAHAYACFGKTRYVAVNTCNSSTIEVRLWRGSLNMETIRATIEATTALAILAKTLDDRQIETICSWSELCRLMCAALESAGLQHSELDSYLARRGLAPVSELVAA